MEQLFTNRKFHFCSHRNFRFFFLNGKRPKKVGPRPFSRLEFVFHLHVSRSLYQFQVHGKKICRAPRRTGVYDQMEQLFTNRKFHFCYHRNFRVFFLNGKRPGTKNLCVMEATHVLRRKAWERFNLEILRNVSVHALPEIRDKMAVARAH